MLPLIIALLQQRTAAIPLLLCPTNAIRDAPTQVQLDVGVNHAQVLITGSAFFMDYSSPPSYIQNVSCTGSQVLTIANFYVEQVSVMIVGTNITTTNCSIHFQIGQPKFLWERNIWPFRDALTNPPYRKLVAADRIGNAFTVFFNDTVPYLNKYSIDSSLVWSVLLHLVPHQITSLSDKVVVAFNTEIYIYTASNGSFVRNISGFKSTPYISAADLSDQAFIYVAGAFGNFTYHEALYPNSLLFKFSLDDGNVTWVVKETTGNAQPLSLSVGPDQQVALQGKFSSQMTINAVDYYYEDAQLQTTFIMLFFSNGTVNWYRTARLDVPAPNYDLVGRKTLINSLGYVISMFGLIASSTWDFKVYILSPNGTLAQNFYIFRPEDISPYEIDFVTLPNEHGIALCLSGSTDLAAEDPPLTKVIALTPAKKNGFVMKLAFDRFNESWRASILSNRSSTIHSCAIDNTGRIFVAGNYVGATQFGQLDSVSGSTDIEPMQYLAVLALNQTSFPVGISTVVRGTEDSFIAINFQVENSTDFTEFLIRIETYPMRGTLHVAIGSDPLVGYKPVVSTEIFFKPFNNEFSAPDTIFDSFTYKVFSNGVLSLDAKTLGIMVAPINDPPYALPNNISLIENQQSLISLLAVQTWGESDGLSIHLASTCAPGAGALFSSFDLQTPLVPPVLLLNNLVFYKPTRFTHGHDLCQFEFYATDGMLNSLPATVSISILHINNPPEAQNNSLTMPSSTAEVEIRLHATDIDGDIITLTISSLPSSGDLLHFATRMKIKIGDTISDSLGRVIFIPQNTSLPVGALFVQFSFKAQDTLFEESTGFISISYYRVCKEGEEQSEDSINCSPCPLGSGKSEVSSLLRCVSCPVGFFASVTCQPCPTGVLCDAKGVDVSSMQLMEGYWRTTNMSSEVLSCPQPRLCQGGVTGCLGFRTGVFCGDCAEGYTSTGTECEACSPDIGLVILVVIVLLLLLAIAAFWLQREGRSGALSAVGIVFYWLQVCSMLMRITSTETKVYSFSEWLDVFNLQITIPLQSLCAMPNLPEGMFLLRLCVPIAWALLLLIILKILSCFGRPPLKKLYPKLLLLFFTMGYAGFSQTILLYFQCVQRGPYYVLYSQPGIHCDSARYQGILILFCIAFIVVPAPLMFLLFFVKNRKLIGEGRKDFAERWGAFLKPYHAHAFWWGSYALCRRTLLIVHDVAFTDLGTKLLAFGLSNLLFVFLHHRFQPLKDPAINRLESLTLYLTLILNLVLGCKPETVAWVVFPLVVVPLVGILIWLFHHSRATIATNIRQLTMFTSETPLSGTKREGTDA